MDETGQTYMDLALAEAAAAAERGEVSEPLPIHNEDVERAMDELICFGGELTQKLLGFRPFGFARRG